jgi:UPF0716 protein FxsA
VPLVELYLLIKIGGLIGALPTIGIVVATGIIGAYLVKLQGLSVLLRMKEQVSRGKFPADSLIDGFLLVVAGALLITPGVLTDIAGFFVLLPATRHYIKKWLRKRIVDYILKRR